MFGELINNNNNNKIIILKVLMCSFNKRNCIVDKSLKIIKLIKSTVRLILDNFGILGFLVFGRMPVDSSHFSPHFESILSPKYFILKALKRSFDPNVRTNWRPTGECSVLNITLLYLCM